MPPSFVHRITKYDPADRDEHGYYTGAEDTVSEHGPVEAAYLAAISAFAEASGIDRLEIRDPWVTGSVHFGVEPPVDGHGLGGLFPPDLTGYHDGAEVSLPVALELVRAMLRDQGAWCRLEAGDVLWEAQDGTIGHAVVDDTEYQELAAVVAGARAACALPLHYDERHPLFCAVLPDGDGVVRARW
ncbi:hypothetical protein [Streptomyces sp. NPDC013455]|uniref:hypothetical protein n=1 Tax=Streptomyces sp. NPDC013455 TaxID=3155605 RepID=UPI0033E612BD